MNLFQKVVGLFVPFIFGMKFVNGVFDRDFQKLLAQIIGFLALFIFPLRQILSGVFNFLLHLVEVFQQLFFLAFGKLVKGFRAQHFSVFNGSNDQTDRHMQQGNTFAFGLFLKNFDIFFLMLFEFFMNDTLAGFIFVTFQNGGNRNRQSFNQFVNVFGKFGRGAGREINCLRFIGFVEIINIGPIIGGRPFFGFFHQNTFDQAGFSGAFRPEAKKIISF